MLEGVPKAGGGLNRPHIMPLGARSRVGHRPDLARGVVSVKVRWRKRGDRNASNMVAGGGCRRAASGGMCYRSGDGLGARRRGASR